MAAELPRAKVRYVEMVNASRVDVCLSLTVPTGTASDVETVLRALLTKALGCDPWPSEGDDTGGSER